MQNMTVKTGGMEKNRDGKELTEQLIEAVRLIIWVFAKAVL